MHTHTVLKEDKISLLNKLHIDKSWLTIIDHFGFGQVDQRGTNQSDHNQTGAVINNSSSHFISKRCHMQTYLIKKRFQRADSSSVHLRNKINLA